MLRTEADHTENRTHGRRALMEKHLTCIGCPLGCQITVLLDGNEIMNISGNTCKKGEEYARREITAPVRTVTTTVRVTGGASPVVSVKTKTDIPKEKIFESIACLKNISVEAPVHIGDTILRDIAGTGIDIVATKDIPRK